MSLDAPKKNKMMQAAPVKKEFHFASDGIHMAEYIEAASIEEATETYHRIKRLVSPGASVPERQSTDAPAGPEEKTVE